MNPLVVVVYWCLIGTDYSGFNPSQLDATKQFIIAHPEVCHTEQVEMLYESNLDVFTCKSQMMIRYMPGWKQRNPDKDYAGGDCIPYKSPEVTLDLDSLKSKVNQ